METITYAAARQNLAKIMKKVCDNHSPVIITRKPSSSVVLMSLEDYESLEETAHLLRSPKNSRRLLESIVQQQRGRSYYRKPFRGNNRRPDGIEAAISEGDMSGFRSPGIGDRVHLLHP